MQKIIDLHTGREASFCAPLVLCLGTFDGVHLGHRALIEETLKQKALLNDQYPDILGGAWCFSQPPAGFLFNKAIPRITDLDEKLELFATAGLDVAVVGDFSVLRSLSASEFVENVLKRDCRCKKSVCGFNFRFGKNALGKPEDLASIEHGNVLVPPVKIDDETISSSAIRQYIESGNVEKGSAMLGRNYSFTLPVVHGKTLGRKLGAPTLNQTIPEGVLIPSFGVYATRATVGGKTYCAVTNIGTNPTVSEDKTVKCETHILGFSGDIYGETVKTEFLKKLRGEMKFSGKDDLAAAIAADIRAAKQYFDLD